MLCWSYGIKLLKARPKALFSNYFWPKSYVACTFSLSVRGARFKWTSSAISGGMLEWACFLQNSSSASDSIELVSSLIPLPAMSTQVSTRQLLSRSQFLLIIDLLRQSTLTQLGRKPSEINPSTLFWVSRRPSPLGGLALHSSSTCKGSHSHFGVCANIQPSFSPGNRQGHRFQALHQHSNIFQLNAAKYKTCEEQAASITRGVVHLLSLVSQGACYWRLDSEWIMRYASAKLMNAASQSKKNQACVQETGFSLSFHKFQSFNICLASSSCALQLTKSLPTSVCPAALCTSATCGETIQDEKCGSRVLFSCKKISLDLILWNSPNHDVWASWWQVIYQWPMSSDCC